jgi:hypothetical protein
MPLSYLVNKTKWRYKDGERMNGEIEKVPTPQDVPEKPVKVVAVQSPDGVHHIYANSISIGITGYDVTIWLSKLVRLLQLPQDEPTNQMETRATVTLAWPEAKFLRNALSDVIEKFEKLNGEINPTPKIPPKI